MNLQNDFTKKLGIQYPIICGAMFPCSNPELVAAASEAGGIGIIQPLSLTYVWKYSFRNGLKYLRTLTQKPLGMNILVEKSSKIYESRMREFVDQSLEAGIRFFVTALGNPTWVVEKVHAAGGIVYHDITERKWALKALEYGVDGLICVNGRAGGHAGRKDPKSLFDEVKDLNVPLVCAGGVGSRQQFLDMLQLGYQAVQMGTRFIASEECKAGRPYKDAIVAAKEDEIVLTEKVTGVPLAVINTDYVQRIGTHAGPLGRYLLKHRKAKHWMRLFYQLKAFRQFKQSMQKPTAFEDYFQAGKSVSGIDAVLPVKEIVNQFVST